MWLLAGGLQAFGGWGPPRLRSPYAHPQNPGCRGLGEKPSTGELRSEGSPGSLNGDRPGSGNESRRVAGFRG